MKKIIIVAFILYLVIFTTITYLNKVFFPQKMKALIVTSLRNQTGKDVTLKSLEFNIFKGLILHDLIVSDTKNVILSTRQATCSIFIWPIFKKQIIIPSISLKAPYIFLERRPDNTFNLEDLFVSLEKKENKPGYNISVFKVNVLAGNIVFQDSTLATKFKKEIKNIQFNLYLGLPANIKFNFKGEMPNNPTSYINAFGNYKIIDKELSVNIEVKNLLVSEFKAYYSSLENLTSGLIDLQAKIKLKDQLIKADIIAKGSNLLFAKEKLNAKLDSFVRAKIDYNLKAKKLSFEGSCDVLQADITGIELLGEIKNIQGKFNFNERSLIADSLKAQLWGAPFEIKLGIKNFNTGILNINTDLDLKYLASFAKEKFNFSLINSATGRANLSMSIHTDEKGTWLAQGNFAIKDANLKLDKQENPIENISSLIEFSQNGFNWKDTKFRYQGANYETSGTLSNFAAPNVRFRLDSTDLSADADINLLGKIIKVNQFKGKYFDSQFSASGEVDNSALAGPKLDLSGEVNLELNDLNKILDKKYPAIKNMRPAGRMDAQFKLNGNPADFKNCYVQAKLTSNKFSLYGLNTQDLSLDFFQDQKIAKISDIHISFYDGLIEGNGMLNLNFDDLPYQLELKANGIKLEKLKLDTSSKNKIISGTLLGEIKINGFSGDLNKLNGTGKFSISEGKLWELNLLQGVGKLIFASDLGNIEVSECACDFLIKDKLIYTDKLILKSNIANLSGPVKIGFDNSLNGSLDIEILSNMIPISGTLKDLTTAIAGEAGIFGVIKLSGTLAEPKYSFKPAVTNIIKGLTDIIFGKKQ